MHLPPSSSLTSKWIPATQFAFSLSFLPLLRREKKGFMVSAAARSLFSRQVSKLAF